MLRLQANVWIKNRGKRMEVNNDFEIENKITLAKLNCICYYKFMDLKLKSKTR
jgi:hypothetical protein